MAAVPPTVPQRAESPNGPPFAVSHRKGKAPRTRRNSLAIEIENIRETTLRRRRRRQENALGQRASAIVNKREWPPCHSRGANPPSTKQRQQQRPLRIFFVYLLSLLSLSGGFVGVRQPKFVNAASSSALIFMRSRRQRGSLEHGMRNGTLVFFCFFLL